MRSAALRLAPAAAWLAIIILFSSLPRRMLDMPLFPGADKVAHMGEYLVLAILAVGGLGWGIHSLRGLFLRASLAVPIMALTACADEWHQRWIPGRTPDLADLAMDVSGIVAGSALAILVLHAGRPGKR